MAAIKNSLVALKRLHIKSVILGYVTSGRRRLGAAVWAQGHLGAGRLGAGRLGAVLIKNRHSASVSGINKKIIV